MTLDHDLLCFVTSGMRLTLNPADSVILGAGASPMSFSAPGLDEPAILLDVGVTHDVQANPPHLDELIKLAPGIVLRALGYGAICQTWGGLLAGLSVNHPPEPNPHPSANQGAMGFMFRIDLFAEVEDFKRQVDAYVRTVRQLTPIAGTQAYLPGGIEAAHAAEYRRDGIPIGTEHRRDLEAAAQQLLISTPW
jgi:LDH2 family malate/lactate/ureidoglycolate dehydrogenase